jgi:spermidine/putrescine transport system permease protein
MAVDVASVVERELETPRTGGGRPTSDRVRGGLLAIWSGLALLYLFIPVFIVVLFSFNANKGRFNFTWQGFTLKHWEHPFADPDLAKALTTSLEVALIATLIATALGTFMAMALVRYRFRGRSAVDFFVFMPLSSPEVVLGAALLSLFLTINVSTGFTTIVIAHVMFCVSYVVVTVKARLEGMDRHIEEAAMDLGATEWATFRKVTLPMIAPGVAAAALLSAALSIDDYVITSFNAGQTQTFPLFIFGATRQGVPPEVNVLATCLLLAVLILMGLNVMLQRRLAAREMRRDAVEEPETAALVPARG